MVHILRSIALILTIFVLSSPGTALAAGTGDGTLEGRLVNGTTGGSTVAEQEVTLKTFRNDNEVFSEKTMTDADGQFIFSGLDTAIDYTYQVTVNYMEADYFSDYIAFENGETGRSAKITVFDSTKSDDALKVLTAYTVVYTVTEMGGICVEEYLIMQNESDLTYIGSGEITATGTRRTLDFPLLDGATALDYGGEFMQCCILSNGSGFSDTMAFLPGNKELSYSYHVDTKNPEYFFSLPVNYPTADYALLIQGENVRVSGEQLAQIEQAQIENSLFSHYTGNNLAPGDLIEASIFGLPEPSRQSSVIWALGILLVLGSGFTLYYLKKNRSKLRPTGVVGSALQEENLLAELARLDDEYEEGKISKKTYHQVREQKKSQLFLLMNRK